MNNTVKRIFELIEAKGVTPYKVSKDTGISNARISNWKLGKSGPSGDALVVLANYFGVSMDYLTGNDQELLKENATNLTMFSERLNELLKEKNITAYKVAKDTGLSNGLLASWKNGEKLPGAENLEKLADYFGVSVDYLLGKEKPAIQEDDGLTDAERELMELFDKVPEDKQEFVLQQVEAALRLAGLLDE